jgi:hypothetical protein
MAVVTRSVLDRESATATGDERDRGTFTLRWLLDTDGFMAPAEAYYYALTNGVGPHPVPSLWQSYSYLGYVLPHALAQDFHVKLLYVAAIPLDPPDPQNRASRPGPRYALDVTYRPLEPGTKAPDPMDPMKPSIADVNPLVRPPVVSWDSELRTRFVERAQDGRQIRNYAKQRFDEPVEIEDSRGVLVVEWNVANLREVIQHNRKFELTVNKSNWRLFGNADAFEIPARAAFCQRVESQPQIHELGVTYYTEVYRIVLKGANEVEPTWDVYVAEQGYQYFKQDTMGGFIKDSDGNNVLFPRPGDPDFGRDQPFRLETDGRKRPDADEGLFSQWEVRRQADFDSLPWMPLYLT